MIAQLTPEMLKGMPAFLVCAGALLWITNELFKLARNVRGKTPEPANEMLESGRKALSRRVHVVEGSISKIYGKLDEMKTAFTEALNEKAIDIMAAGERRSEAISEKFQEVKVAIAKLEERTKNQ